MTKLKEWVGASSDIIKGPGEIVEQQVLGYVFYGVEVEVKSKATNGF